MSNDHAFLAPSSAHIWGDPDGCPAYPRMAAAHPDDTESPAAREGTAAHHYISETLVGRECPIGGLAPNGHPITDEMVECAEDLLADVATWRLGCGHRFAIEQRLDMPSIHPTLNWGTCDIGGMNLETRTVYLRDYKFGHRYVDAWENLQLVDYVVGLFRHFAMPLTAEWDIDVGIFQPRSYHPDGPCKIWRTTGARIMELADAMAYAARKATAPDAPMHTGAYCGDCSARYACPALQRVVGGAIDLSLNALPQVLPAPALGLARSHISGAIARLEALASGLDAQIEAIIRGGKHVPGWELKQGMGREYWSRPIEEVYALGDLYGKELRKPQALTPVQARNLGIDEAVISAYSDRRKGEIKVSPIDDTRAAKAFK